MERSQRVHFSYNLDKDVHNWWKTINSKNTSTNASWSFKTRSMEKKLVASITATDEKEGKKILKEYLERENKKREDIISLCVTTLEQAWATREEKYFDALEKLLNRKVTTSEYTADITTLYFGPYSPPDNWFMVPIWLPLLRQVTGVAHELLHIEFIKTYGSKLNKLGNTEKTGLVEASTVLLNTQLFSTILPAIDQGYTQHEETRARIKTLWENGESLEGIVIIILDKYK